MSKQPKPTKDQRRAEQQKATAASRSREEQARHGRARRRTGIVAGSIVLVVALVVTLLIALPTTVKGPAGGGSTVVTEPFTQPTGVTLSTSLPPWALPTDPQPFIEAAGLSVLGQEQLAVHYHAHLDLIMNGTKVPVVAGIGMIIENGQETGVTVLHTHDETGVIHIESATDSPYTLGQLFTEWGVQLSTGQIGGLSDGNGKSLRTYVDGKEFTGDPATVVFSAHQEITLWFGADNATPVVASQYKFPAGD